MRKRTKIKPFPSPATVRQYFAKRRHVIFASHVCLLCPLARATGYFIGSGFYTNSRLGSAALPQWAREFVAEYDTQKGMTGAACAKLVDACVRRATQNEIRRGRETNNA